MYLYEAFLLKHALKKVLYENRVLLNKVLYTHTHVTLDHKTSHTGTFFEIEIYTSSESFPLIYSLLGYDNICPKYNYLKIWNLRVQKNLNI